MTEVALILHDIRSVYNVGAIFRTANAAGVSTIYLTGYTPGPLDRFKRERKDFAKTALGAEKTLQWQHREDSEALLAALGEEGFLCIALEQSEEAKAYTDISCAEKVAFVLGNEVEGVPRPIIEACDHIAEITQYGSKESLNVSVAAGIMLFSWRERCN